LLLLSAGLALLALFGCLTAIALRDHWFVPSMDIAAARFCEWALPGSLRGRAAAIAQVASVPATALWTATVVVVLGLRRRWPSAMLALAGIAAVVLIEAAIRVRLDHLPASPGDVVSLVLGRGGWTETYPSGHTARIALVGILYPALVSNRVRPSWLMVAIVLICAVGVQRVASGLHTFDEALGGALLGSGVAIIAVTFLPKPIDVPSRRL
jgi:membrane-associated phospholipid phosphatase